ncbi:MAG: ferredoxin [Methanomicrobiales archaeon]|nr:ferredoxin [Methanomicrobiales archaeon]
MGKCTIVREDCTSCGTCWDLCPEFFEQSTSDSLSQIVEGYRRNENPGEGDIPPDMEGCIKDAADSCPVQIITIEE